MSNNTVGGPMRTPGTPNIEPSSDAKPKETIKGTSPLAGKDVSWIKTLATIMEMAVLNFIKSILNQDPSIFLKNAFTNLKSEPSQITGTATPVLDSQQKPETPSTQIPAPAIDNTTPEESKNEAIPILNLSQEPQDLQESQEAEDFQELEDLEEPPEVQSEKFQNFKSKAMARDMTYTNKLLGDFQISWDRSLFLRVTANAGKDFNGTIGEYRIKVISTLVTELLNASENSSDISILKNKLQELQKNPNSWFSSSHEEDGLDLKNDRALIGKIDELLQLVETAESKAKANEEPIHKAETTSTQIPTAAPTTSEAPTREAIKAGMELLDKRLMSQFGTQEMKYDVVTDFSTRKMKEGLVSDAIADAHKDFNGSIGEYRIKVISTITTKLLDEAKDNPTALAALKGNLEYVRGENMDAFFNVIDQDDNSNLADPKSLLAKEIDKLLVTITTAETAAKAKEAANKNPKTPIAASDNATLEKTPEDPKRKKKMDIIDKRLVQGKFGWGGRLTTEAAAGVRKNFNSPIGQYRIQVITAIVPKIVDEVRNDPVELNKLKISLEEIKRELYILLDVGEELNLDDKALVIEIDRLLKDVETAAAKATLDAILGIKEKISACRDLAMLTNIEKALNNIAANNPEIKTDPHFKETEKQLESSKKQLESSIEKEIRPFLIKTSNEIIANTGDLTALTNIKRDFDAKVAANPKIKEHLRFNKTNEQLDASIKHAKYLAG